MPIPPEWLDPIEAAASLIAPERLKDLILEAELAKPDRLPGGRLSSTELRNRFVMLLALAAEDEVITSARETFHLDATAEYGLLAATYLIIRANDPLEINEKSVVKALEQLGLTSGMRQAPLKRMHGTYQEVGLSHARPPQSTLHFHLLEARLRAILIEGEIPRPCSCPRQHTHHDEPAFLRLSFPHCVQQVVSAISSAHFPRSSPDSFVQLM
jgi:hypothetical protein